MTMRSTTPPCTGKAPTNVCWTRSARAPCPPGARLTETEIADRLAISRTPVREAIRRLEADGLVDHRPRTGAVVRQLSYPDVMELYEMRVVLEGTAARLAARGASEVEIEDLSAINADMAASAETDDAAAVYRLNQLFHTTLLNAARNRFLMKSVQAIQKTLLILGPSTLAEPDRVREALEEHRGILDALAARDGAAAEQRMRQHMERAQRSRLRLLRARDLPGEAPEMPL